MDASAWQLMYKETNMNTFDGPGAPTPWGGDQPLKETRVGPYDAGFGDMSGAPQRKETIILGGPQQQSALAFLVITSGQYANTMLPLSANTTRIGRDGRHNDHMID